MAKKDILKITKKQIAAMKKYFKSEQFKIDQAKANEESDRIQKSMQMTWEKWCKIKDIPYM